MRRKKSSDRPSAEEPGSYPVVIVPGWGAPMLHTNWIARQLEAERLSAVKIRFPYMGVGDMDESAGQLKEKVEALRERLGVGRVNLIGYSLGGLIARVYLQEFGGREKVARAVYVGAPQDGVYTAYPASFTKGGRQVRRGSAYMRGLNSKPCRCEEGRCLSIFLWKDGIILPSESARLPCGYNLKLTWPVFHWGIVFNRRVVHTAAEFLKGKIPGGAVPGGTSEVDASQ